ncbi:MAG: hypothetical protein M3Y57_18400 [Acidobacteriota bacterium]|nr:hypothetical protein [Acidobacteriota bacterium]
MNSLAVVNAGLAAAVVLSGFAIQAVAFPPTPVHIANAYHFIGFGNVKPHRRGALDISEDGITFSSPHGSDRLQTPAILRFNLDYDSRALLPCVAARIADFAPFGEGIAIDMIRTGIDVVSLDYRDPAHGLHQAVFFLPKNESQPLISALSSLHIQRENTPLSPVGLFGSPNRSTSCGQ